MRKVIAYSLLTYLIFMGWVVIAQAYEVVEVKEAGMIHGTVTFSGIPPKPLQFEVEKNPDVCGAQRSLVKVEVQNGLLKGAVVILEGIEAGKPFAQQEIPGAHPGKGSF